MFTFRKRPYQKVHQTTSMLMICKQIRFKGTSTQIVLRRHEVNIIKSISTYDRIWTIRNQSHQNVKDRSWQTKTANNRSQICQFVDSRCVGMEAIRCKRTCTTVSSLKIQMCTDGGDSKKHTCTRMSMLGPHRCSQAEHQ